VDPWGPCQDEKRGSTRCKEELIQLCKNEELKIQFRKDYQKFWLQKDIPVANPAL